MVVFENANVAKSFEMITSTLILWGGVGVTIIIARLFVSVMADRMAHEEFNNSITSFFSHTMQLSMAYHTSTSSGKMSKELIRGTDNLFYAHLEFFRKVMPEIFMLLFITPLIMILNWKMGLFVISM